MERFVDGMDRVGISIATDSIKKGDRDLLQGHYLDGRPEKLEKDVVAHTVIVSARSRVRAPLGTTSFVSATSVKSSPMVPTSFLDGLLHCT